MTVNVLQRSSCYNHFTFKGQNCKSLISIKKIEFWLLDIFMFVNNIGAVILCRHLNLKKKKKTVWGSVEAFRWVCGHSWQTCFYTSKHTPDSIKLPSVHTAVYLAGSQVIAWDCSTWDKHNHSQQPWGQCAVGCNSLDSEKEKRYVKDDGLLFLVLRSTHTHTLAVSGRLDSVVEERSLVTDTLYPL